MLASFGVWANGIKVWMSFRASCACELIERVGAVLTDWMITIVARIESNSDSKCVRCSAITPWKAAGRGVERPAGLACGTGGSEWPMGALLGCAACVAAEVSEGGGPVSRRPRLTTRSVCGDLVCRFVAASSEASELVESGERGRI